MHALASWWDGIELWVTGLPFIPQSVVVLVVIVPIAFGLATLLDHGVAAALHFSGRDGRENPATQPDSQQTPITPTESV